MNPNEIQKIYKNCTRFFNLHYPEKLKEKLNALSIEVNENDSMDFYGSGKTIEDFEKEVALILGKKKSLFSPSGTMVQSVALRIWCDKNKNPNFGMHVTSHLELHENKAYFYLHKLSGHLLGDFNRVLNLEDIKNCQNQLAAIIMELPQLESGGILPEWAELVKISNWCKANNVYFHLDGARLWECAPFYKKTYSEICDLFDSVYVSFYKGLGAMAGAVLAGPEDFINESKVWQRRQGGNLITLSPLILSARMSLRLRKNKMEMYHQKAVEVAKILSEVEGIKIVPEVPQTNMMHIYLNGDIEKLETAAFCPSRDIVYTLFLRHRLHSVFNI